MYSDDPHAHQLPSCDLIEPLLDDRVDEAATNQEQIERPDHHCEHVRSEEIHFKLLLSH